MAVSIRNAFAVDLAKSLLDELQFQRSNYYYFLGSISRWTNEESPPAITPCDICERKYRSEMVFVKKVSPGDVSLTIQRVDWTSGVVYDQWDHTQDMRTKKFYVLTDDYNVYKCIYNNEGAPSTVKPSGKSFYTFETSDGYVWKYMYNIPSFKVDRFLNVLNIPVQNALSNSFYSRGEIEAVSVLNGGSGYTVAPQTTISVNDTGKTTGSGATVELVIGGVSQSILSVTVTNGGSGYTKGARIKITGIGKEAVLVPVIVGGVIQSVTVENGGYGYFGATAEVEVGGAKFVPTINNNGSIIAVEVADAGIGYTSSPTLTVVSATGVGSNQYPENSAVGKAIVSCVVSAGKVVQANIVDPGIDYPIDNSVTIQVDGDGTGAVLRPVVVDGKIVTVIVDSHGTGYSYANLIVTTLDNPEREAVLSANISLSDFNSDQTSIEQLAIPGAIHAIKMTSNGKNYTASTVVSVEGNGTGCVVTPVISNGVITKIKVVSPGSGYTFANVVITDPGRLDSYVPPEDAATAYAILPPVNGHGSDSINELFATTFSINSQLDDSLGQEITSQDFRSFGIIKNPRYFTNNSLYRKDSEFLMYTVVFADATGLQPDTVVTVNNNRYRVFSVELNTVRLVPLDDSGIVPLGEVTNGSSSYLSTKMLDYPELNKYSGNVLYISTEEPFTFDAEQRVSIKTYISF